MHVLYAVQSNYTIRDYNRSSSGTMRKGRHDVPLPFCSSQVSEKADLGPRRYANSYYLTLRLGVL